MIIMKTMMGEYETRINELKAKINELEKDNKHLEKENEMLETLVEERVNEELKDAGEFTEFENYICHVYGIDVRSSTQVRRFELENKEHPEYLKEFHEDYEDWKNGRTQLKIAETL